MEEINKNNYFNILSKEWIELSKKWKFSYSSWSDVWDFLKKKVPDAKFEWIENSYWTLWLVDDYWCFAKVRVYSESLWVDVTQYLHAMNYSNQAVQKDNLTAWEINKAYQRCMVKAVAVWFGLWLYIYRWEDFPEESDWNNKVIPDKTWVYKWDTSQLDLTEYIEIVRDEDDVNNLDTIYKDFNRWTWSEKQIDWMIRECKQRKEELNSTHSIWPWKWENWDYSWMD